MAERGVGALQRARDELLDPPGSSELREREAAEERCPQIPHVQLEISRIGCRRAVQPVGALVPQAERIGDGDHDVLLLGQGTCAERGGNVDEAQPYRLLDSEAHARRLFEEEKERVVDWQ